METIVRRFRHEDAAATARIFFDAVRCGAGGDYDRAQRRAWAPAVPATAEWLERLTPQTVLVAEQDGRVVGFMSLTNDGCIDLAYVAPDRIGHGIAKQLYDAICAEAATHTMTRLHTEASHLARAFFERQGWTVLGEQTVTRNGVDLTNFWMEKKLS